MLPEEMKSKVEETDKPIETKGDINMPAVTAKFEMLTVDTNNTTDTTNTTNTTNAVSLPETRSQRVLRNKTQRKVNYSELSNRRCSLRPKKRTLQVMESDENVAGYYLDKTLKHESNNLETIFEEAPNINENFSFMSSKKFKRMIQFKPQATDVKLKKRKTKVKRIFGSKINHRPKRGCSIAMSVIFDKLDFITFNLPKNSGTETK